MRGGERGLEGGTKGAVLVISVCTLDCIYVCG